MLGALRRGKLAMMDALRSFRDDGYGIVKGVFARHQIDLLLVELDRLHALGSAFSRSTEDGPVKWLVPQPSSTPILRFHKYKQLRRTEARSHLSRFQSMEPVPAAG